MAEGGGGGGAGGGGGGGRGAPRGAGAEVRCSEPFLMTNSLASSVSSSFRGPFVQPSLANLGQFQIDHFLEVFGRQVAEDDDVVDDG